MPTSSLYHAAAACKQRHKLCGADKILPISIILSANRRSFLGAWMASCLALLACSMQRRMQHRMPFGSNACGYVSLPSVYFVLYCSKFEPSFVCIAVLFTASQMQRVIVFNSMYTYVVCVCIYTYAHTFSLARSLARSLSLSILYIYTAVRSLGGVVVGNRRSP